MSFRVAAMNFNPAQQKIGGNVANGQQDGLAHGVAHH